MACLKSTKYQISAMVDFMAKNENVGLASNMMPASAQYKDAAKNLWGKLAEELNSHGPPMKDVDGWKKVWKDYKYNIRTKLRFNRSCVSGTGGGPFKQKLFSTDENKVIMLLDLDTAINGLQVKKFDAKIDTATLDAPEPNHGSQAEPLHTTDHEDTVMTSSRTMFAEPVATSSPVPPRSPEIATDFDVGPAPATSIDSEPGPAASSEVQHAPVLQKKHRRQTQKQLLELQIKTQQRFHEECTVFFKNAKDTMSTIRRLKQKSFDLKKKKFENKKQYRKEKLLLKRKMLEMKLKEVQLKEDRLKILNEKM